MRIRPSLLLGFGAGIVLGGAVRILDAMGAENTIWTCLFAAIVATFLTGAISR